MEYLLGEEMMQRVMLRYFNTWKFRHPGPLDFMHVAELESGMVLDWYYEYWVLSTKTVDYAIKSVEEVNGGTLVTISRKGLIPMPVEFTLTTKKGQQLNYYIPLNLMRGIKPQATGDGWEVLKRWDATAPEYTVTLPVKINQVSGIEIDASGKMADVQRDNNSYPPEASSN
jgi:hypothetical protein